MPPNLMLYRLFLKEQQFIAYNSILSIIQEFEHIGASLNHTPFFSGLSYKNFPNTVISAYPIVLVFKKEDKLREMVVRSMSLAGILFSNPASKMKARSFNGRMG